MKTTIQKLIDDRVLMPTSTLPIPQGTLTKYFTARGKVLAFNSQPCAYDLIDHVRAVYDAGIDHIDCELVSMAGEPHTKYVGVNREIEIKIFREEC